MDSYASFILGKTRLLLAVVLGILLNSCSTHSSRQPSALKAIRPKFDRQDLPEGLRYWISSEQDLLFLSGTSTVISEDINQQDPQFRPETKKFFELKTFWVDETKFRAFEAANAEINPDIKKFLVRQGPQGKQYRLIVHPESEAFYQPMLENAVEADPVWGTPLASPRTLLIVNPKTRQALFIAKVSLDAVVGGNVRRLIKGSEVARSVGGTQLLKSPKRPDISGAKFIEEPWGIAPIDSEKGGMIIRSLPPEVMKKQQKILPLFALYAPRPDGQAPLMARWIKESKMEASDYLRAHLIAPFVKIWMEMLMKAGLTSEPHAQNVLMAVDEMEQPQKTFYFRDNGGLNFDLKHWVNTKMISSTDQLPSLNGVETDYYQDKHSEMINLSLWKYFSEGVLIDLQKQMILWQKKGWIKKLNGPPLEQILEEEVSKIYSAQSGKKTKFYTLFKIGTRMINLRQKLQCEIPLSGPQPPTATSN